MTRDEFDELKCLEGEMVELETCRGRLVVVRLEMVSQRGLLVRWPTGKDGWVKLSNVRRCVAAPDALVAMIGEGRR